MSMPWYGIVILAFCTALCSLALAYSNWVAHRLAAICHDIAVISARVASLETGSEMMRRECAERLSWLRQMDAKLDRVSEDVAVVRSVVEGQKESRE